MEFDPNRAPTKRKAGYFNTLFRGLIILFGLPALGLLLHLILPSGPTMGLVFVACLPSIYLMREYTATGFGLALLALCITGLSVFRLDDFKSLTSGARMRNVTVSEARANDSAVAFYFKDATLQREYKTEYSYRTTGKNSSKQYYYAAPLTDRDWTASEPVEAWVIAYSFKATQGWDRSLQTGIRLTDALAENSRLKACIKKAQETHGLVSVSDPLLIEWADPDTEFQSDVEELKRAYVGVIIFWFFAWTIYWIVKGRKNR
jgi:hypothetical protein